MKSWMMCLIAFPAGALLILLGHLLGKALCRLADWITVLWRSL